MKAFFALSLVVALAGAITAQSQPAEETSPENAAIIANDRAYEAAYAKGDVKALAAFFAEDAEFTSEDGRTFNGRAQIEESIRAAFAASKGAKLTIDVGTVKVLTPEVVIEKGSTTVTSKTGEASSALYAAVHVKKGGKWQISQLIETPMPDVTPHEQLSELAWLIGEWEDADKSSGLRVRSEFVWARGGNFITRNVTVKREEEVVLEGWQIIGWNPVEEHIRSWLFDGDGGFAEGVWTREGDRWLVRESGVNPEGGRTSADNTIAKLNANRFSWESNNRTLNGEPAPSTPRVEVQRVKGN